mgnify:CR=1 FL=1
MKLKFYITIFISLLALVTAAQDATLIAKVSKNKLGLNQRLRVEFSINKQGGDNFSPPKFSNFKVENVYYKSLNRYQHSVNHDLL